MNRAIVWLTLAACTGGFEPVEDTDGTGPGTELEASCAQGNAADCTRLAEAAMTADDGGPDFPRVLELLGKACDGGDGPGCARLGAMHESGEGVDRDLTKAAQLYGSACEHDDVASCARLGNMYLDARGVQEDVLRASKRLEKACTGGHGESCAKLSSLYAVGARLPRSPIKSRRYAERGCDASHLPACLQLAERQVLDGDDREARALLEAVLRREQPSNPDRVVLEGLRLAAGEKPDVVGSELVRAWKAVTPEDVTWSWDRITGHLGEEKKRRSKESVIVLELLGSPRNAGTEAALRAALGVAD